ncbi:MAG TPA: FAD-binding oxidoreductase [Candidatus Saccharimonadia bacterium]|jgi:ferredoxin-NADP reductase
MTATPSPVEWRVGTVRQIRIEAPGVRTYTFSFESPVHHSSGQHYEIRLTASDGYQAARLYSAATPASGESNMLQLTIGLMPYGEVSPYLFNHVTVGSQLEIRGPLGRYFVWSSAQLEPIFLIGGGTGVIPLRSIWTEHMMTRTWSQMLLLYAVRSYQDVIYKYDLIPRRSGMRTDVILTFTDQPPLAWKGYDRRIDGEMVMDILERFRLMPSCYVCGPTPMVEAVTQLLVQAGVPSETIKAERFGPTGGAI